MGQRFCAFSGSPLGKEVDECEKTGNGEKIEANNIGNHYTITDKGVMIGRVLIEKNINKEIISWRIELEGEKSINKNIINEIAIKLADIMGITVLEARKLYEATQVNAR